MKKLINFNRKDKDIIMINILLNNYCNQNCSYCCANFIKERPKYDFNSYYINLLLKEYKKRNYNETIKFNILGGEPTISPSLFKTLNNIYENDSNIIVKLTSNGKESVEYYKKLITNFPNLRIRLSYHPEFADDEHFIELNNLFNEYNMKDHFVGICLYYPYYNKIINFMNKIKDINMKIELIKLAGVDYINDDNSRIFNDILKSSLCEALYVCEYDDNTCISMKESEVFNMNLNTNIFKDMYCKNNYMWDILAEGYIKFMCIDEKYRLLPNDINRFLDFFDKHKDGIICSKDVCNLDCNIMVSKHI